MSQGGDETDGALLTDVDDVSFPQGSLVGNSVANNFVHRPTTPPQLPEGAKGEDSRADRLWEVTIIEWGGVRVSLNDGVVYDGVDGVSSDPGFNMRRSDVQDLSRQLWKYQEDEDAWKRASRTRQTVLSFSCSSGESTRGG
jgi:hypothetical protein